MSDESLALPTLEASMALVGVGEGGRRAVEAVGERRTRADANGSVAVVTERDDLPTVEGATLVAVGPDDATPAVFETLADVATTTAVTVVVTTTSGPDATDRTDGLRLDRLRRVADTVVVCSGGDAGLTDGLDRLVRLLDTRSVVNLDAADLATVLERGDVASFSHGRGDAQTAVSEAFDRVPTGFRVDNAPAALVHVVGTSTTSVEDAGAVVDAVRERVDTDAHLIWGTTIAEGEGESLELELVAGGVGFLRGPGDPCPRCADPLVRYSLGERSTVVCDRCGYSGNAVRLR